MTKSIVPRLRLLLAMATLACDAGGGAPKVSLAQAKADSAHNAAGVRAAQILGPDAQAALDSGNALFRRKAYARALERYQLASTLAPAHAAPYFGINMVAQVTHDKALGDSALAAIRERGAAPPMSGHPQEDSAFKRVHAAAKKGRVS